MKHSKAFLAVTTCFLAIAGIAATKASKSNLTKAHYITNHGTGVRCFTIALAPCTAQVGANTCVTRVQIPRATLYTATVANKCSVKLFTSQL